MTAARIPLSYCGLPPRSDSSAPHSARLTMLGGWPGSSAPEGGVHCVLAGACGGAMRIAEMLWPYGWALDAGRDPKPSLSAGRPAAGAPTVTGASIGRVTAIWMVLVVPTNTGSVLRGPSLDPAGRSDAPSGGP